MCKSISCLSGANKNEMIRLQFGQHSCLGMFLFEAITERACLSCGWDAA